MTVSQLADTLGLEVLAMPEPDRIINGAYAGDLLSWVMGRASADCVWATIMSNLNVVAVASLADTSVAVICEDCEISPEIVATAKEKNVNLLRTSLPVYEFCVALSKVNV